MDDYKIIAMSDEAHFHPNGYVDKKIFSFPSFPGVYMRQLQIWE